MPEIRLIEHRYAEGMIDTLCWNCENAYADRCFKTEFVKRKWIQDCVTWKGASQGTRLVLKCKKYKPEGERRSLVGYLMNPRAITV